MTNLPDEIFLVKFRKRATLRGIVKVIKDYCKEIPHASIDDYDNNDTYYIFAYGHRVSNFVVDLVDYMPKRERDHCFVIKVYRRFGKTDIYERMFESFPLGLQTGIKTPSFIKLPSATKKSLLSIEY